jgi:signal-transduction protein with cAMP-binding, CBS, and nucleotidyltransferase domain
MPDWRCLIGEGGFLDRSFEKALAQEAGICLMVPRRKNIREQLDGCTTFFCQYWRKRVESTFSQLAERLARSIHVVTAKGLEIKVFCTVLAFSLVG